MVVNRTNSDAPIKNVFSKRGDVTVMTTAAMDRMRIIAEQQPQIQSANIISSRAAPETNAFQKVSTVISKETVWTVAMKSAAVRFKIKC